jgi:hypothetical protein
MSELTHSHFGGFLLHRGWFRPSLATETRALLSTGDNAVSPRQNINCAYHIGVVFVATAYALEMRLRWPILGFERLKALHGANFTLVRAPQQQHLPR